MCIRDSLEIAACFCSCNHNEEAQGALPHISVKPSVYLSPILQELLRLHLPSYLTNFCLFYDKQKFVRYDGRCSLNNSCRIGERYTEGLTDICGRAPCASSLWLHEQKQ